MGLAYEILGPVRAYRDGRTLRLPAGRPTAALVTLLLHAGSAVPVERLCRELWGARPPASAVANLRSHVSQLRHLLTSPGEPVRLRAECGGYLLRVEPGELDAAEFERLADEGRAARAHGATDLAAARCEQALALWSPTEPPPAYGPITAATFDRLRERRAEVRETYAQARLELGDPGSPALTALLRRHVVEHPLRESAWSLLMRAQHRAGDRSAALQTYRAACRALAGELGVPPGPELTELYRTVRRGDGPPVRTTLRVPGRSPRGASPLRLTPVPHELPCAAAPFVGRRAELARLTTGLTRAGRRPTTLSVYGMAGAGKSALALRAAAETVDTFPDGQLHLDLGGSIAGARLPPLQVANRVLRSLDPAAGPATSLAEARARVRSLLFDRRVLLVLDNATDPAQVEELLPVRGGCAVVVTSRTPVLDVAGRIRLEPLPQEDGLALLRATVGDRPVDEEPESAVAVVAFCEGLPLALRTAARRLAEGSHWSMARLARLLRDERFRLAETGLRPRLSASYHRLGSAAVVFRLLGRARPGPVTADQVAALTGVPREEAAWALDRLVAAQLAEPVGRGHFRLGELVRLYAAELAATEASAGAATGAGAEATAS
ncbi:AfsR/SARP family transcriptional regulator [Micromonospora coxensis]|uniref:DNA-binding transcriptional activator of the SARP family n=1 Tax=Micromonospora coxensis TaxID=356852 RepID=A0A1C5JV56_9ACTN|nr:AfsR/SARP family transcriptional regulator [Micromonospora coxensis]SCG74119.1 DNA-binding transcriptional activator of the SARP family [Micromonospora coxensis]